MKKDEYIEELKALYKVAKENGNFSIALEILERLRDMEK